jgi:Protein of unknown function (DUF2955)
MERGDKAALRLTIGLGAAVLVAYGLALPAPFVVCVLAVLVLSKPGPPLPLVKAAVVALMLAVLITIGVLMVPLLENYAATGVLLTATILYSLFYAGLRKANALTLVFVISIAIIPVAGVAEQALAGRLSLAVAVGIVIGALVNILSSGLFPDLPGAPVNHAAPRAVDPDTARWIALRATLIVMPVFVLALTNPSLYLAAILKTVALGQQAGETNARSAGKELVGSTVMGALIGACVWMGLSLLPNLWMLMLWLMGAALWTSSAMYQIRVTRLSPSFWSNALITALILLGPAIEDSASGKSVLEASVVRSALFLGVAFYAWGAVWVLERWRSSRSTRKATGPVSILRPTGEAARELDAGRPLSGDT